MSAELSSVILGYNNVMLSVPLSLDRCIRIVQVIFLSKLRNSGGRRRFSFMNISYYCKQLYLQYNVAFNI